MNLRSSISLQQAAQVQSMLSRAKDFYISDSHIQDAVNLTLYLCSEAPELSSQPQGRPGPKRTKKGLRHFPPKSATEVDVGYRVSRFLRRVRELGEGGGSAGERFPPAPHIRRAHWHTYWTGPRREPEKRRPVLCWIPPTPVGFAWDEVEAKLVPTVKRVNQ